MLTKVNAPRLCLAPKIKVIPILFLLRRNLNMELSVTLQRERQAQDWKVSRARVLVHARFLYT
jgi:hypothetical protein